jgi:hypothetical protein
MSHDLPSVELVALELQSKEPMQLALRAQTAFALVGVLQLALRHPRLTATPSTAAVEAARGLIECVREYFEDCPAVGAVIDAGEDPDFDT